MTAGSLVQISVEGPTDEPVARRILTECGLAAGRVYFGGGKSRIDDRLHAWNRAASRMPWFVLRDLDHDADCAPSLVAELLPSPAPAMQFRIAVREVEAWLLADREQASRWLQVPISLVPREPELIGDPKQALIELARRSRSREIRRDVVPPERSTARVGRGYRAQVQRYAESSWRPVIASRASPSLARCLAALRRLGSEQGAGG